MIISDLTYLQDISEASEVLGGSRKKGRSGFSAKFDIEVNKNYVKQSAKVTTLAISLGNKGGKTEAYSYVSQDVDIDN